MDMDSKSEAILNRLSKDSRASLSSIAREIGVSPVTVKKKLDMLEKKLDIKYLLRFNEKKLGFLFNYFITIKFKKIPSEHILKEILLRHPAPQFAAICKGDFNFIAYISFKSAEEYFAWTSWFRHKLQQYIESWNTFSLIDMHFGFFPLREELISDIDLKQSLKDILHYLHENSRIALNDLARLVNLSPPTVKYHLTRILHSNYITMNAMSVEKTDLPIQFVELSILKYPKDYIQKNKEVRYRKIRTPKKTLIAATISGTADFLSIYSFKNTEDCYKFQNEFKKIVSSISSPHSSALILKVILGKIPYNYLTVEEAYSPPNYYLYLGR